MEIIFCADPLSSKSVDSDYIHEAEAVAACSYSYSLINYENLVSEHKISFIGRRMTKTRPFLPALYRGWMLTPETYTLLYHGLQEHGIQLINSPTQYQHCHYLPKNYPIIQTLTPKTVWIKNEADFSISAIMKALEPFGTRPVILKDYVKSQKHYWHEACFIPSANNEKAVSTVVKGFLKRQTPEGGLVFREYVALDSIGKHAKSGMPLSLEYRIFFMNHEPIAVYPYWDETEYPHVSPPLGLFENIAQQVDSLFFTMDVAKSKDLGWIIIELGDGQVAGLPENADFKAFFQLCFQ
jgi:hypothetical protein